MAMKIKHFLSNFEGHQTIGRGSRFWFSFFTIFLAFSAAPLFTSRYALLNLNNLLINTFLALSLCLLWGYGGILSLGQSAFFGIGGYAYGIVGINSFQSHQNTNLALICGVLVPFVFAFILGLILFYSRLKGVYVSILSLVVSLITGTFLSQTASSDYRIGDAALGGSNGLKALDDAPSIPSIVIGFGRSNFEFIGSSIKFYYLLLFTLVVIYLGLRWLVNSRYGYSLIGVREDSDKTETFGYDVRLIQLIVFCISAALAGLSGIFYTSWGNFIVPGVFSVQSNILPVIWVAVGGRKDFTTVIFSTIILQWLSLWLNTVSELALVIMGILLVVVMLVAPEGLINIITTQVGRPNNLSSSR